MNIGGNYNFGVWNPPTGLDSVKYSENLGVEISNKLNNLQTGKEEGIKQKNSIAPLKIESPDTNLIATLANNYNLNIFTQFKRQGWGGRPINSINNNFTTTISPSPVLINNESEQLPLQQAATKWLPPSSNISINLVRGCTLRFKWTEHHFVSNPYSANCESVLSTPAYYPDTNFRPTRVTLVARNCEEKIRNVEGLWAMQTTNSYNIFECELDWLIASFRDQIYLNQVLGYVYYYYIPSSFVAYDYYLTPYGGGMPVVSQRKVSEPTIITVNCLQAGDIYTPIAPPINSLIYTGIGSPPPLRKMECCSCNDIADIIQAQLYEQGKLFETLKNHIDQRIKEEIAIHGKQLEALEIDLQPVIDRINEAEFNLWNGVK